MNLKTAITATALLSGSAQAVNWQEYSSSVLIEVKRNSRVFTSSAVVIKRNVILTAAHSVEDIDEGHIHLNYLYEKNNPKIKFKKIIIHPEYDKEESNYKNDIALIILENNLPDFIKIAKITSKDIALAQSTVDRIGFGGRNGQNSRTWTNPKVVKQRDEIIELKDKFSVIGDSGGPIYYNNELLGIHSTKEGDEKTYAVYVPKYSAWIQENIPLKEVRY